MINESNISEHRSAVNALAFKNKEDIFASGSDDFTIKIWNVQNGLNIKRLYLNNKVNSIAFNSDDSILACGMDDGKIIFYDESWNILKILNDDEFHIYHKMRVRSVCFNNNGTILARFGSEDNTIKLWKIE